MTVDELLRSPRGTSGSVDLDDRDNRILLCHALQIDAAGLISAGKRCLEVEEMRRYCDLVDQRMSGTPIPYLTGRREFWSLELLVDNRVLIPRHETETLVERVLDLAGTEASPGILELGTGSGAIAIALAKEIPGAKIMATDVSGRALEVASQNTLHCGADNVELIRSDWFRNVPAQRFNIVCSNPPYIEQGDVHLGQGDLRYEPNDALVSGHNGLSDLEVIVSGSRNYLVQGGWLVVEHGYMQGKRVRELFFKNGFDNIKTHADLAQNERITEGQYFSK